MDYGKIIECLDCKLHFQKKFLEIISDENILAIEEMKGFIEAMVDSKDPKKIKEYYKALKNGKKKDKKSG